MRFIKLAAAVRRSRVYSTSTTGLFNKPQLQNPQDWVTYAQDTIRRCVGYPCIECPKDVCSTHCLGPTGCALCRCQPIVEQAVTAPASANTIQLLDDISDHVSTSAVTHDDLPPAHSSLHHLLCGLQLCQVYDSAEFCRNVHANPEWQQQAVEALMVTASKQYC